MVGRRRLLARRRGHHRRRPLLATRLTDDPRLIGAASVAFTAPFILFGIPAGLLVDRVDIRAMMVRVDVARAVLLAVLALGVLGGWGGLPLLYVCMFLLGVGEVLCRNAAQVLVPFLTPQAGLATANARVMAVQEAGTGFVGPLVGALLFGVATVLPFGVDAATFLCSAVLVSRIRRTRPVEPAPTGPACCRRCWPAPGGCTRTTCCAASPWCPA